MNTRSHNKAKTKKKTEFNVKSEKKWSIEAAVSIIKDDLHQYRKWWARHLRKNKNH